MVFKSNFQLFNTKSVFLGIILFFLTYVILIPIVNVKAQSVTNITVETAYDMINDNVQYPDLIILDVRGQSEYDENHICNSILIPVSEIDSRIGELEPYNNTEIIVYCQSGSRSALASENLVYNHNFTKIYNMLGGITDWIAEGYAVCNNGQQNIDFNLLSFSIILFSAVLVILAFYKKKK